MQALRLHLVLRWLASALVFAPMRRPGLARVAAVQKSDALWGQMRLNVVPEVFAKTPQTTPRRTRLSQLRHLVWFSRTLTHMRTIATRQCVAYAEAAGSSYRIAELLLQMPAAAAGCCCYAADVCC
jgi:hypothetical protein